MDQRFSSELVLQVVEVDAFASVHDMIHAAIASYGKQATLREVSVDPCMALYSLHMLSASGAFWT